MSKNMPIRTVFKTSISALAFVGVCTALPAIAQTSQEPAQGPLLEEQFRDPPPEARPYVWWHWMNGNITKEGIAEDLAWMKRVGIGGLQNFDANINTPQVVEKRLVYMTPEWRDAFRFAAEEADRHGLELAIAASPGFSETGGPWVAPQDGLKKLVWSETELAAGKPFAGKLAPPPSVPGPFQSLQKKVSLGAMGAGTPEPKPQVFYADVGVLAFPFNPLLVPAPVVEDGTGARLNASALLDDDLVSEFQVAAGGSAEAPRTIVLDYDQPQTVRSARLFAPTAAMPVLGALYRPRLEASEDGTSWRAIAEIPTGDVPVTVAFAPVTARRFRLVLAPRTEALAVLAQYGPGIMQMFGNPAGFFSGPVRIASFRLSAEDRIDRAEAKAAFELVPNYFTLGQGLQDTVGIAPSRIVNLTSKLRPDGGLDWTPPPLPKGQSWKVMRFGYSLTGTTNHPAPPEATGLEVDKFDGPAVRRYLEHYLGMYRNASGGLMGEKGIRALLTDSTEVGAANWTPRMVQQFTRLRGYDPTPWLPALAGLIVGSREQSDKFLFDFRRTLAELHASEHYGTVAAVAHEQGLKVYGEALEDRRPVIGDDMAMRRHADVPMAAMWTYARAQGPRITLLADIKGAASVAHIYGQNLVAAESLTAGGPAWGWSPAELKRIIDLEFALGVNRPVIHTSVHAPGNDKLPGLSLGGIGQYFNRHETWAEMAKPWMDYMARNSLLLQQGRHVADVAYFYGEEAPLTALYGEKPVADAPKAYGYDFVNAEALGSALANEAAELVTPGGARYRALFLGGQSYRMTLLTLRKLAELVERGATVIGHKPEGNPSLAGDGAEWSALVAKLWSGSGETRVGQGKVIASRDVEAALRQIGVAPDFRFDGQPGSEILFLHRRLADGDAYFLSNRMDRSETIEARFRVTGKAPELWHATTGTSEPVSYRIQGGETIVPMTLSADQSVHVVFRKPAVADALQIEKVSPVEVGRLDGPWQVAFQPGRGAPPATTVTTLAPLDESTEAGIKYFSGIATYTRTFTTPPGWRPGQALWLDLGEVGEMAEVSINGRTAGTTWHVPHRIEIGSLARRGGGNRLQIKVANLWVNRLIGDAQPGSVPLTWTGLKAYTAQSPLRRSGLIGPVTLHAQR